MTQNLPKSPLVQECFDQAALYMPECKFDPYAHAIAAQAILAIKQGARQFPDLFDSLLSKP